MENYCNNCSQYSCQSNYSSPLTLDYKKLNQVAGCSGDYEQSAGQGLVDYSVM